MSWDEALRHALRRREPPPGFAERVLERLRSQPAAPEQWPRRWSWVAVAASIALLLAGGWQYREYRQRLRGEQAREQLLEALQITAAKLEALRDRIHRIGHAAPAPNQQENRI